MIQKKCVAEGNITKSRYISKHGLPWEEYNMQNNQKKREDEKTMNLIAVLLRILLMMMTEWMVWLQQKL